MKQLLSLLIAAVALATFCNSANAQKRHIRLQNLERTSCQGKKGEETGCINRHKIKSLQSAMGCGNQ